MMRIKEILAEAISVPETQYGYWVSPTGDIIPVKTYGHEETIYALSGGRIDGYQAAFDAGWVRIVAMLRRVGSPEKSLMVHTESSIVSARALAAIAAIARDPRFYSFTAEFGDEWKRFTEPGPFMAYVRQSRV